MPDPVLPKAEKPFDSKDPNPCAGCSNCCEYVALEIDTPTSLSDFDNIFWYVLHKDVWIYVDDEKDWYIQFNTPCDKLVDRRCDYYPHRPQLCRDYEPENCVRYGEGEPEKYLFKNEADLFRYLEKKRPKIFDKMKKKFKLKDLRKKAVRA